MACTDTITIYRGEDVQLNFTLAPVIDITGYTLAFAVEGVAHAKLIEAAGVVVSGPAGTFSVTLADTDTDIKAGAYQYDVWRTDAGSERVLAVGIFRVKDNARHPAAT